MTLDQQARVIRRHYGLRRKVTQQEVQAEVDSLRRKHDRGSLCDRALALFVALKLDGLAV